jgi:hypothetical protein
MALSEEQEKSMFRLELYSWVNVDICSVAQAPEVRCVRQLFVDCHGLGGKASAGDFGNYLL